MEDDIIELRNWFRENGNMDFELNKNLPKKEQGKTITYNCKDIDNIFEIVLSNSKINNTATIEQLQNRIKELEGTIENMKAISLPKEEVVNGITSVDYPSDNETEINVFIPIEINYWKGKSTHIYRKSFSTIEECQAFFDNMHKEDSGERWGTMLCDYRTAKWEYKENGDLLMRVNHDGAIVEYICMNCGRKIKK